MRVIDADKLIRNLTAGKKRDEVLYINLADVIQLIKDQPTVKEISIAEYLTQDIGEQE